MDFQKNSSTNAHIQLTDENEHFAHLQMFGKELAPSLWDHQKTNKTQMRSEKKRKNGLFPWLWRLLTVQRCTLLLLENLHHDDSTIILRLKLFHHPPMTFATLILNNCQYISGCHKAAKIFAQDIWWRGIRTPTSSLWRRGPEVWRCYAGNRFASTRRQDRPRTVAGPVLMPSGQDASKINELILILI